MTRRFAGLWAIVLLSLIAFLPAVQAQTSEARSAQPFYDVTREIILRGTASSLVTRNTPGMLPGGHLLISTPAGTIDASLGRFGLRGNGALSLAAGDQVEVTGVMQTLGGRQVLVVRTVKVGEQVYVLRNQFGIPVSPQARERAAQKAESGEEL
jgi:hypothetical protein